MGGDVIAIIVVIVCVILIYSCKCFELDIIKDHLDQFGLISGEWMMIDRNDGLEISSRGSWENA